MTSLSASNSDNAKNEEGKIDIAAEVWKVFTYYSLHGDPLEADYLHVKQFSNMLKHSKIFEKSKSIIEADGQVVYRSVCKGTHNKKMNFAAFLNGLQQMALKRYKKEKSTQVAFSRFIKEHVLLYCKSREPNDLSSLIKSKEIILLEKRFHDSLEKIFQYYATGSPKLLPSSPSPKKVPKKRQAMGKHSSGTPKKKNTMLSRLAYDCFMGHFSQDFLITLELSKLQLGDCFLATADRTPNGVHIPGLTYNQFWELIVRCSLVAFEKYDDVTEINKVKELLSVMGNQVPHCVPRAVNAQGRAANAVNGQALMAGGKQLQIEVHRMWKDDGETGTYLSKAAEETASGLDMLSAMSL
eukprot:g3682.t1